MKKREEYTSPDRLREEFKHFRKPQLAFRPNWYRGTDWVLRYDGKTVDRVPMKDIGEK